MIRWQNIIVFRNCNKHNRVNNTIEQIDNPNNYITQQKLVNNNNPFLLWSSNLKKNGDYTWRFRSWDDTETTVISNNLLLLVLIPTTTIKDGGEQHELWKKCYYLVNPKIKFGEEYSSVLHSYTCIVMFTMTMKRNFYKINVWYLYHSLKQKKYVLWM